MADEARKKLVESVERVNRLECAGKDIPGIDDWEDDWVRGQFESYSRVVVDDYKVAGHDPDDTLRVLAVVPEAADEQEIERELDRWSLEVVVSTLEREGG